MEAIDEYIKNAQEYISSEIERRLKKWIASAQGIEFTETLEVALRRISILETQLASRDATIAKLKKALEELVVCKNLKEAGNNREYMMRKPEAWDRAREVLAETKGE